MDPYLLIYICKFLTQCELCKIMEINEKNVVFVMRFIAKNVNIIFKKYMVFMKIIIAKNAIKLYNLSV